MNILIFYICQNKNQSETIKQLKFLFEQFQNLSQIQVLAIIYKKVNIVKFSLIQFPYIFPNSQQQFRNSDITTMITLYLRWTIKADAKILISMCCGNCDAKIHYWKPTRLLILFQITLSQITFSSKLIIGERKLDNFSIIIRI